MGSSHPIMIIKYTERKNTRLQKLTRTWHVNTHRMTFNVFCRNFREKRQIWVSEPHFGEVRGDARPWLMARWKADGRLSIRLNWTFFAICYGYRAITWNVSSLAVSTRGLTSLHSNFTWTGSSPSIILGIRKLDTGLPDGEDRIPLHSLVLTQYRSVTNRRTDGRICRRIFAVYALQEYP